jgi:hypothetical protein
MDPRTIICPSRLVGLTQVLRAPDLGAMNPDPIEFQRYLAITCDKWDDGFKPQVCDLEQPEEEPGDILR